MMRYIKLEKAEKIVAFNAPAMQLTIYTCILLISWIGSKTIVAEECKQEIYQVL